MYYYSYICIMKTVYILRGVPGCGKSTLAEELTNNNKSSVICSADDYHMHDGKYVWDESRSHAAHLWCMQLFEENLKDETEIIVVSNTNVKHRDIKYYRNLALEYDYKVFVLVVENWHEGVNTHDVPEESLKRMENSIRSNIKLR